LSPQWPTGSSSGWLPSIPARSFSASPSDSTSRWTPCPPRSASRPARRYPRHWIWCSPSEHQWDFNPPEHIAAQRTLRPLLTSASRSGNLAVPSVHADTMQISRGKLDRLHRTPAESTALALMDAGLRRFGPARPTRDASYSVSVRQVAALLPRFFQTAPRGRRPCASLALCLTRPGQRTFTSKLSNMLGTPVAVDAKNAPTATWKTAQNAVSHSAHTRPCSLRKKKEKRLKRRS